MDLASVEAIAEEIIAAAVKAAPIIIADYQASKPYVQAIVELYKAGGVPTADNFAATRALLDQGSDYLTQRAAEAAAEGGT